MLLALFACNCVANTSTAQDENVSTSKPPLAPDSSPLYPANSETMKALSEGQGSSSLNKSGAKSALSSEANRFPYQVFTIGNGPYDLGFHRGEQRGGDIPPILI